MTTVATSATRTKIRRTALERRENSVTCVPVDIFRHLVLEIQQTSSIFATLPKEIHMRPRLAATIAAALWLSVGATARASEVPATARQGFGVEPFRNAQRIGALQHLSYGLPALIAERFAQVAPLRFAGRPELFARTAPAGAAWLVGGTFERKPDWNVAVTVEIHRAGSPNDLIASATRVGSKDALDTVVLDAAA